jgi:hypothetical protein
LVRLAEQVDNTSCGYCDLSQYDNACALHKQHVILCTEYHQTCQDVAQLTDDTLFHALRKMGDQRYELINLTKQMVLVTRYWLFVSSATILLKIRWRKNRKY